MRGIFLSAYSPLSPICRRKYCSFTVPLRAHLRRHRILTEIFKTRKCGLDYYPCNITSLIAVDPEITVLKQGPVRY